MATWLPNQVRLLGYSPAFRNALADLISTARAEGARVRETSSAFQGHEGEEALYQFAGRIQGLLELSDREAPEMVGELEEAVRNALTSSRREAQATQLRPWPKERLGSRGGGGSVVSGPAAG